MRQDLNLDLVLPSVSFEPEGVTKRDMPSGHAPFVENKVSLDICPSRDMSRELK